LHKTIHGESVMMKFLLWAIVIIFIIGVLVVTGVLNLIF
jgi:hypothetical protein